MRTIILLLAFIFSHNIHAESDSLYVTFSSDTVRIWDSVILNCCSQYQINTNINAYQITLTQIDTSSRHCRCICPFNLCTSLFGLAPGEYVVNVFRIVALTDKDTTIFAGSINFNFSGSNIYSHVTISSFQSGCNASTDIDEELGVTDKYILEQNYPNPFNPITNFEFRIADSRPGGQVGLVTIKIYDVLGNEVATLVNEVRSAGKYKLQFDGSNLVSGVYFYKLTIDNYSNVKKMIILK